MEKKVGRPRTIKRDITSSTQEGLAEGWTRATFIVKEEHLRKIQRMAKERNKKMKEIIDEVFSSFLKGRNE
jgi:galactose-1-phosphate uridylyltransferase